MAESLYVDLYRRMLLIRFFEAAVWRLYGRGEIHGSIHLYDGQEAVAVGVTSRLGEGDRVAATYRGHGVALALGVDPTALLAELLGRSSGVCQGRAGSMNVVDLEHRLIGCFGIVGGSISAATGAALALRDGGAAAVSFFGDGATNQAYFSECLNFAQALRLPAVFVCENNLYGEFSPVEATTMGDILDRPRALGIPAERVDGNDVWEVRDAAARALEIARSGRGPAFIEARTYRFVGHSRSDPARYRRPGELEEWKTRDPLLRTAQRLAQENGVSEGELEDLRGAVDREVEEAEQQALAAPQPDPGVPMRQFKD